jgi:hypothetical protein
MIYTIGHTRDYLLALACKDVSGLRLEKIGRRQSASEEFFFGTPYYMRPFSGGSVWASREEAEAYIESKGLHQFAVFGVEASWDQTAESWASGSASWRDLLIDAPVRRLEVEYYDKRLEREAETRRQSRRQTAE